MIRRIIWVSLLFCPLLLNAQPYEHSGGIRAGLSSGISYKGFFLHRMSALGIDALYNPHGLNISALYEMHTELTRNGRLLAYGGGGLFGGRWDEEFSSGLCVVGGIEFTIRKVPINIGAEWKPMLNVYRLFDYELLDFGITIRYRFGR